MISSILGLLTALPQLLKMIDSFWSWINKVSNNDPSGFLVKTGAVFDQLSKAQSQEEHADAAKALSDLIRNMPAK